MNWTWWLIRGTGVAAVGLLTISTVWGLLLSTGVFGRAVRAKSMTYLHESLGIGALLLTLGHVWYVYKDEWIAFDWQDILIPGEADWRPVAISYGIYALYGLVIVTLSFYVRKHIGQSRWRMLHFLSFGVFVAAILHGVMSGTDTQHPVVLGLYVASGVAVALLVTVRVMGMLQPPKRERRPARTPAAVDAGDRTT